MQAIILALLRLCCNANYAAVGEGSAPASLLPFFFFFSPDAIQNKEAKLSRGAGKEAATQAACLQHTCCFASRSDLCFCAIPHPPAAPRLCCAPHSILDLAHIVMSCTSPLPSCTVMLRSPCMHAMKPIPAAQHPSSSIWRCQPHRRRARHRGGVLPLPSSTCTSQPPPCLCAPLDRRISASEKPCKVQLQGGSAGSQLPRVELQC